MPSLYGFMLNLWQMTLIKHHGTIQKEGQKVVLFSRSQARHILSSCFSLCHLMVRDLPYKQPEHLKNFRLTVEAMLELI